MSRLVDISPYKDCRIVLNPEDSGFPASELPTVDAVEVVRCGKCVESYDELCRDGYTWCNKYNQVLDINGFCSYGARKETKE